MPVYDTSESLTEAIEGGVRSAVKDAGQELLEILQEDYIDRYVYGRRNIWYTPTGQFRASWRKRTNKIAPYMYESEVYYNPSGVMFENSEGWEHYSKFKRYGGAVEELDKILNVVGSTVYTEEYPMYRWNKRREAYWDSFTTEVYDGGKAERILNKKLREHCE